MKRPLLRRRRAPADAPPSIDVTDHATAVVADFGRDNARRLAATSFLLGLVVLVVGLAVERSTGRRLDETDGVLLLAVVTPQLMGFLTPAVRRWARSNISRTASFVVLANLLLLMAVSARHTLAVDELPYLFEFVILQLAFSFLFSGQRLWQAVATSLVAVSAYVAVLALLTSANIDATLRSAFALVMFLLIGSLGRADIERRQREQDRKVAEATATALVDQLTGLANRRGFNEQIERSLAAAAREGWSAGLAVIDLDGFKRVNDRHGHRTGDEVLSDVSAIIRRVASRPLDLSARMGGDEFVIVWVRLPSDPKELPARLLDLVRRHDFPERAEVGLSIGYVTFDPDATTDLAELLEVADQSALIAKRVGGNRIEWIDMRNWTLTATVPLG